jgi:hypothetical protein
MSRNQTQTLAKTSTYRALDRNHPLSIALNARCHCQLSARTPDSSRSPLAGCQQRSYAQSSNSCCRGDPPTQVAPVYSITTGRALRLRP